MSAVSVLLLEISPERTKFPVIETETVAGALSAVPSLAAYVKESEPSAFSLAVYVATLLLIVTVPLVA